MVRSWATLLSVKRLNTKREDSLTTLIFIANKFNEKSPALAGLFVLTTDEFKQGVCVHIH